MNYKLNKIYLDMMGNQQNQIHLLENLLNEKVAFAKLQENEIGLWRTSCSKAPRHQAAASSATLVISKTPPSVISWTPPYAAAVKSATAAHEFDGNSSNSDMDFGSDSHDSLAPFLNFKK